MTLYVAYFDSLGFEFIYNMTNYEHEKLLAILSGKDSVGVSYPHYAILRAQANPQRFPEIWAFESDIDQETLEIYARETPQQLADLIRKNGQSIYCTPRSEAVIV